MEIEVPMGLDLMPVFMVGDLPLCYIRAERCGFATPTELLESCVFKGTTKSKSRGGSPQVPSVGTVRYLMSG